nr:two-component sensor histidine kinase [Micromonospora sp. DSM 115978]
MPTDRRRWAPSRWTLRVRLLVALTALLAAVSVVVVVVTTVALRGYLLDQVDDRLVSTDRRAPPAAMLPPLGMPLGPSGTAYDGRTPGEPGFNPGQGEGTLAVWLADGEVVAAQVLRFSDGEPQPSPADVAALSEVPVDGEAHSVDVEGLGSYRVLATLQDNGQVRITGIPLDEVDATTGWTVAVGGVVALAGTAAAGVVGAVIIRRTLRPLRRVAATASRVT